MTLIMIQEHFFKIFHLSLYIDSLWVLITNLITLFNGIFEEELF